VRQGDILTGRVGCLAGFCRIVVAARGGTVVRSTRSAERASSSEVRTRTNVREEASQSPPHPPPARRDARDSLAAYPRRRAPPVSGGGARHRAGPPSAPTPRSLRVAARRGVIRCDGGREGGGRGVGVPGDVVRDAAEVLHARRQGRSREDQLRGVAGRALRQQRAPDPRRLHRPCALTERFLCAGHSPR
jgi:hypothetical protein